MSEGGSLITQSHSRHGVNRRNSRVQTDCAQSADSSYHFFVSLIYMFIQKQQSAKDARHIGKNIANIGVDLASCHLHSQNMSWRNSGIDVFL